ncbi:MAG: hypothetical protein RMY35_031740 [Nostoc sp. DedSLP01]
MKFTKLNYCQYLLSSQINYTLTNLVSAICDQFDRKFQPSYQKQQPHPLKDKTGGDCDQSDRGNTPQMCDEWICTVCARVIPPKPYPHQKMPSRPCAPNAGDRALVELIAKWSKCEWQEKIPTVIKSIGNLEATKGGLEELLGYWSKILESGPPQTEQSKATDQPIGYYSNRSLDWHKATFCELLDLGDKVGQEQAIANFSTRYDQQHTGATDGWLNWLQINYPQMYAHLYPQAA